MTTYILHGGIDPNTEQVLAKMTFWPEILKLMQNPFSVLCIYAASTKDKWQDRFACDLEAMRLTSRSSEVELVCGADTVDELVEQIAGADVIYLRGGKSKQIMQSAIAQIHGLGKLFEGKVVAGTSAGAMLLSKYYYSRLQGLGEGLGIVACKVIAHYSNELIPARKLLEQYGENYPILDLHEDEYVVLTT